MSLDSDTWYVVPGQGDEQKLQIGVSADSPVIGITLNDWGKEELVVGVTFSPPADARVFAGEQFLNLLCQGCNQPICLVNKEGIFDWSKIYDDCFCRNSMIWNWPIGRLCDLLM